MFIVKSAAKIKQLNREIYFISTSPLFKRYFSRLGLFTHATTGNPSKVQRVTIQRAAFGGRPAEPA
jgi:hypothetical protein